MIQQFEEWASNLSEMSTMEGLRGAVVGIEASEYLNRLPKLVVPDLSRAVQEALLPALGGVPFGVRYVILRHLAIWKNYNITPVFVFGGLDVGKRDHTFLNSEEGARISARAWDYYDRDLPNETVQTFAESSLVTARDLYRYLQGILWEQGVEYQVAPYGAWAQLAYLQKVNAIDTIYGSSEVLLFDVSEIITGWNFVAEEFVWVRRRACLHNLGDIPHDAFVDACILSGSDLSPTLPQLENNSLRKQPRIRNAIDMVMNIGRGNGHNVCLHYQDDATFRAMDYLDRYRKARLAVKHHVVLTLGGKVQPFDVQQSPKDVHEFIGQRLPDELYHYLARGVISPRTLNWRTSGEILETPPLDGGDSEYYRKLVRDQLTEMRTSTIGLLSYSLHRFYAHRDLNLRCWFDKDNVRIISMKEIDDPRPIVESWNVSADVFGPETSKFQDSGLIGSCVKVLKDKNFAAKTITKKSSGRPLKTKEELLRNSIWRLLHLRGYLDEKHNLTEWGEVLYTILSALPSANLEEGALTAVELARFGLLNNSDRMFPNYSGGPHHGSDKDKRNTLLIARIACFGARFKHKEIGYTGPLSRNLLGYSSMVNAVRSGLRDLIEVCLTTMLLNGDASRDRSDLTELGLNLPFVLDNDCILGIAASSHLGTLVASGNPSSPSAKDAAFQQEKDVLFRFAEDFEDQIASVFALWDAVYKGIEKMPSTFKQKAQFEEANKWLIPLR